MQYNQIINQLPKTGAELFNYDYTCRDSTPEERELYKRVMKLASINSVHIFKDGSVGASDTEMWFNEFLSARITLGTGALPNVTARQLRIELLSRGLLAQVEAQIQACGPEAQIEWEFATEYEYNHVLVNTLAAALNIDKQELWEAALDH